MVLYLCLHVVSAVRWLVFVLCSMVIGSLMAPSPVTFYLGVGSSSPHTGCGDTMFKFTFESLFFSEIFIFLYGLVVKHAHGFFTE